MGGLPVPRLFILRTLALLTAAIGLLTAMPYLQASLSDNDFYGLRTDLPVPALAGAEAPQTGLNVVFFGYRHCGDVCPKQLGNLKRLQAMMAEDPVQFVFVTLDPERDQQAELSHFNAAMGPQFVAVRPQTARAAQALALAYGDVAYKTPDGRDNYTVQHAGHLYVVSAMNRKQLTYAVSYTHLPSPRD